MRSFTVPSFFQSLSFVAVSLLALSGCAGQGGKLAKEIDKIRNDINVIRVRNLALQDRVDALEVDAASTAKPAVKSAPERPALRVVRLTPPLAQPRFAGIESLVAVAKAAPAVTSADRLVLHNHDGQARAETGDAAAKPPEKVRAARRFRRPR
jgi:hypothetical protein